MWNAASTKHQPNQFWYPPLKKLFGEVTLFDPHEEMRKYGPEGMKLKFFEVAADAKPDYILFFGAYDLFDVHTIKKINEMLPRTKTIMFFGDDDVQFETMSRYYATFVDYVLVGQTQFMGKYESDGLHNAFPLFGANFETYGPMECNKKYDTTLIGTPVPNRIELVRFLLKNSISIRLWGHGWQAYPEFGEIWSGPVDFKDFLKITCESKINLSLTLSRHGVPHIKGRVFETAACGAFQLVGRFSEYLKYFEEGKDIIMFDSNEDLLEKIRYYLAHEQERERIASNMRRKAMEACDLFNVYADIFGKIIAEEKNFCRPELSSNKKIAVLSGADMAAGLDAARERISSADYVSFNISSAKISEHRDYFLAHALGKTGKDISCCEYYINSRFFENCTLFQVNESLDAIGAKDFNTLLDINQLMVTKKFFLDNFEALHALARGKHPEIVNRNNTVFVSMPLVWISKFKKVGPADVKKAFRTDIVHRLQFAMNNGRLPEFMLKVLAESISQGNTFLLWRLAEAIARWRRT